MVLQGSRVLLCLLQDGLHYWILNDADNLRITLDALDGLLLRLSLPRAVHGFDGFLLLLIDFAGILPTLVVLVGGVACVEALVVLAHGKEGLRFSQICANELRVAGNCFVAVLDSAGESEELNKACGPIRISTSVLRSALDHFGVCFDGSRPISFLEFGIAQLSGLFCCFWANVSVLFGLNLCLLCRTEFGEYVRGAMLS